MPAELGQRFCIFEDFRVEEDLVGLGGFLVRRWSFRVVFQSCLVELEGVFDLDFFGIVNLVFGFVVGLDIQCLEGRLYTESRQSDEQDKT